MSMHCDSPFANDQDFEAAAARANSQSTSKWQPNLTAMFSPDRLVEALGQTDAISQMATAHYVPTNAIWPDHEIFNAAAEVARAICDGSYRPEASLLDEPEAVTSQLKWRIDRVVAALLSEAVKEYVAGQLPPCLLPPTPLGKWSPCGQKTQPRWKVFGSLICSGVGQRKTRPIVLGFGGRTAPDRQGCW